MLDTVVCGCASTVFTESGHIMLCKFVVTAVMQGRLSRVRKTWDLNYVFICKYYTCFGYKNVANKFGLIRLVWPRLKWIYVSAVSTSDVVITFNYTNYLKPLCNYYNYYYYHYGNYLITFQLLVLKCIKWNELKCPAYLYERQGFAII